MRLRVLLGLLALGLLPVPAASAASALERALDRQLRPAGPVTGALVVDADTGARLYARRARTPRIPASVEKLWTTSAALRALGPGATFATEVLATRDPGRDGVVRGRLWLRGGGDPSFGIGDLASLADRLAALGLRRVTGRVLGDESRFDARRGLPSSGWAFSPDVEPLSALAYGRNLFAGRYVRHPASRAAAALALALRRRGVHVGGSGAGVAPLDAVPLAEARSPALASLVAATNIPSDNFYAEVLLKDLGAELGTAGTTAQGAAVARAELAELGLRPRLVDGSGLDRGNRSSPAQVVGLLRALRDERVFTRSLAVAGRSGTLRRRLRGTVAAGRCRGKTGTLRDVSNLAGICTLRSGRRLAFAVMMTGVWPPAARIRQDRMVRALYAASAGP